MLWLYNLSFLDLMSAGSRGLGFGLSCISFFCVGHFLAKCLTSWHLKHTTSFFFFWVFRFLHVFTFFIVCLWLWFVQFRFRWVRRAKLLWHFLVITHSDEQYTFVLVKCSGDVHRQLFWPQAGGNLLSSLSKRKFQWTTKTYLSVEICRKTFFFTLYSVSSLNRNSLFTHGTIQKGAPSTMLAPPRLPSRS